jgi:cysteine desulfurase
MRVYLDCNATTPVCDEAREAMLPYLGPEYGNPSSIHREGQRARHAVEEAREAVAALIGAEPSEVFFTSGGTESNNLALAGFLRAGKKGGRRRIVTTGTEHTSVLEAALRLATAEEAPLTLIPVARDGTVDPDTVRRAAGPDTALVSVMHANNETGVFGPVEELGKPLREAGVPFHVDAAQSFGKVAVDVRRIACDALTLSGHKVYGPKGAGALYVRRGARLEALFRGGGQEKNVRPGTENVAGIAGFAAAARFAERHRAADAERLVRLKNRLLEGLRRDPGGVKVHGAGGLPGTLNVSLEGVDGPALAMALDLEGVAVSTGSACAAGSPEPSHVLTAMGVPPAEARGAVRFSLGHFTTEPQIDRCLEAVSSVMRRLRKAGAHAR